MNTNVAVMVGSLRAGSLNKRLARALQHAAPQDWTFATLDIGAVPHYDDDLQSDLPGSVKNLKRQIADADALMIVSPEYNRSMPGVLKNAIDWASRPPNDNVFAGKPTLIAGATTGRIGTAVMQSHLRTTLAFVAAVPMPQPELYISFDPPDLIDAEGRVKLATTEELFGKAMAAFAEWVGKHGG